jgi:hypothetical protein
MAGTAQSNAVERIYIMFLVVDMMNAITKLSAQCAGVVVAFAYHFLEFLVELKRVWLVAFPVPPIWGILPRVRLDPTFLRAITSPARIFNSGLGMILDFSANWASKVLALFGAPLFNYANNSEFASSGPKSASGSIRKCGHKGCQGGFGIQRIKPLVFICNPKILPNFLWQRIFLGRVLSQIRMLTFCGTITPAICPTSCNVDCLSAIGALGINRTAFPVVGMFSGLARCVARPRTKYRFVFPVLSNLKFFTACRADKRNQSPLPVRGVFSCVGALVGTILLGFAPRWNDKFLVAFRTGFGSGFHTTIITQGNIFALAFMRGR